MDNMSHSIIRGKQFNNMDICIKKEWIIRNSYTHSMNYISSQLPDYITKGDFFPEIAVDQLLEELEKKRDHCISVLFLEANLLVYGVFSSSINYFFKSTTSIVQPYLLVYEGTPKKVYSYIYPYATFDQLYVIKSILYP